LRNSVSNSTPPGIINPLHGLVPNYAIILFLIFFTFTSCSLSIFPDYKPMPVTPGNAPVSWFETDTGRFLFNTRIDLMKNYFTGILIIKPAETGSYRTIMITETGLKIMDLEFFPETTPKVHYIIEAMDRKVLLRTLTNDLSLILMNQVSGRAPDDWLTGKQEGYRVARYRIDRGRAFYYIPSGRDMPSLAKQVRGITNKVRAEFYGYDNSGPDSVKLSHYNIALKLNLYRINELQDHVDE